MKKFLYSIFLLGIVLSPSSIFALTFTVTGTVDDYVTINGCYTDTGNTNNSHVVYTNNDWYLMNVNAGGSYWVFSDVYPFVSDHDSYNVLSGATDPDGLAYLANASYVGGVPPPFDPPIVVEEVCEGGESTTTPPVIGVATSTASTTALLGSISFGLAIIMVPIWLFLIGYFYNSITPRKPWK